MRRSISLWLVAALLVAAPTALAQSADPPSTYVVSMCRADGRALPLTEWRRSLEESGPFHNTCANGGSFGFLASGWDFGGSQVSRAWIWDAPPDLSVVGFRSYGVVQWTRLGVRVTAGSYSGGFGPITGGQPLGSAWREVQGLNASRLTMSMDPCRSGPGLPECLPAYNGPPPGPPETSVFEQFDMVLRDAYPPEVTRSDLTAVGAATAVAGTASLTTGFSDRGGGVSHADILVDGAVRERRNIGDAACAKPYTRSVPCPTSGTLSASLDTTALSEGAHTAELRVYDVAGNRATVGPVLMMVQNSPASTRRPERPGRVTLRSATLRIGYGTKRRIEGSVADLSEQPIPGATVEFASRVAAPGTTFGATQALIADEAGRFTIAVPPGPSRIYRVRYADSEATTNVVVKAPLTLKASPAATRNGRSVRFIGSIAGASAPGIRVELQARAGKRWVPFRTASLRNARFSARYRFTNTTVRTRYSFRAVVRADPDLPYAANVSKTVRVLVRP